MTDKAVGLQCHTAPFSWKLVFEHDHQLFEITMSACSRREELEWRSRLTDRSCKVLIDAGEQALYTSLSLDIKPLGTVFGKPGMYRCAGLLPLATIEVLEYHFNTDVFRHNRQTNFDSSCYNHRVDDRTLSGDHQEHQCFQRHS